MSDHVRRWAADIFSVSDCGSNYIAQPVGLYLASRRVKKVLLFVARAFLVLLVLAVRAMDSSRSKEVQLSDQSNLRSYLCAPYVSR